MQSQRFDRLTKTLGHRLSRRSALAAGTGLAIAGTQHRYVTAQEATPVASPVTGDAPAWLLIQRFESATLSPTPDGAILILEGVEHTALAFTDRPAHLARFISSVQAWTWADDPANPPNATLLGLPVEGGDEVAVVVELLETHYDETAGRVTATVQLLGEGSLGALDIETALTTEQRFGAGHIFIDDLGDEDDNYCQSCDSSPDYYQERFQWCLDGGYGSCFSCADWVGCRGEIETDKCGRVSSRCDFDDCRQCGDICC